MSIPAIVEASPARVAARDRAGWLALFSDTALLEDPVGAAQHRGAQLGDFYDTFIAPNRIHFEVEGDAVAANEVFRDLTIVTRLSTGVELRVPAFVRYRISADGARLDGLAAYWQVRTMVWLVMRAGVRGLWTVSVLSWRMFRHLGVRGVCGFVRALSRGVFGRGQRVVASTVDALNRGDGAAVRQMFAGDPDIEWAGDAVGVDVLIARAGGDLVVDKLVSAGRSTVCRVVLAGERGVARFEFAAHGSRLVRVVYVRSLPG